jgi:ferredoxin--NADP+ reductase
VPNDRGRVAPGVFVVGWIKRGPRGFIGTNKTCAQETVEAVLDHLDSEITEPHHTPDELIAAAIPRAGDLAAWRRLDAEELALGRRNGRPRVKIVDRLDQEAVAARVNVRAPRRLLRT